MFSHLLQLFGSDQTQSERQQWFYDLVEAKSPDLLNFVAELNDLLNFNFDTKINTIKDRRASAKSDLSQIPERYCVEELGGHKTFSFLSDEERREFAIAEDRGITFDEIDIIIEKSKEAIIVDLCKLYFEAIALSMHFIFTFF